MSGVCIAILAKDKAYCLPLYLECILNQTYPKDKTHLYIRTNDNKDSTAEILAFFVRLHGHLFASVHFDDSSIDSELKKYGEHEWNTHRFAKLGAIRQASCDYARDKGLDYFVIDCDNFIVPQTLERMVALRHLGVVAPMIDTTIAATNIHHCCTHNGYYQDCKEYHFIRNKVIRGIMECKVVHCVYFIPHPALDEVVYDDGSMRYEYVIFSNSMRTARIKQFIDNSIDYGYMEHDIEGKYDIASFIPNIELWKKVYPELFKTHKVFAAKPE
jgi:hypothetical protein